MERPSIPPLLLWNQENYTQLEKNYKDNVGRIQKISKVVAPTSTIFEVGREIGLWRTMDHFALVIGENSSTTERLVNGAAATYFQMDKKMREANHSDSLQLPTEEQKRKGGEASIDKFADASERLRFYAKQLKIPLASYSSQKDKRKSIVRVLLPCLDDIRFGSQKNTIDSSGSPWESILDTIYNLIEEIGFLDLDILQNESAFSDWINVQQKKHPDIPETYWPLIADWFASRMYLPGFENFLLDLDLKNKSKPNNKPMLHAIHDLRILKGNYAMFSK